MLPLCKGWSAIVVGLLVSAPLIAQDKPGNQEAPCEKTAKAFVALLGKGDFEKATADFDETMLKVLPAEKLKDTWAKVVADAGAFKKQLHSRTEKSGKYDIVIVTCAFEQKKTDARVVFDKDGKITGLLFRPTPPTGEEEIFEGTLKAGAIELRLVFHFFKQKDGTYLGTMDSPDQGAKGIPLDEVTVKEDAVRLELKIAGLVYEGKRDKDGKEISGNFKQGGQTFPLTLKKVAKARETRRPQTPRQPYPYDEIEVAYDSTQAGIKLAGALTVPRSGGPFPAVLLISGSGPQDRDETLFGHKPFLVLADHLTRHGIAVLRVDDRGVGGSTGKTSEATSADFAADVLAGVAFLKGRKEIDPSRIGLVGHSEGGIIAPLVAGRSRDVAFIVLLAGTGLPGEEVLYLQGAALLKVAGADAEGLARQKAIQQRIFEVIRAEKDNAVAEKKIRAALDEYLSRLSKEEKMPGLESLAGMSGMDGQVRMALSPWFRHFLDYDPRPALHKVTCPVLALNGDKDMQVPAEVNLKAIAAALKQAGNKDVTTRLLPNLNHLFQTCKTGAVTEYGAIEETMAAVALETIADWILKRAVVKAEK
jgi:pimeloyl-ACP methyl ester carboxylesterase